VAGSYPEEKGSNPLSSLILKIFQEKEKRMNKVQGVNDFEDFMKAIGRDVFTTVSGIGTCSASVRLYNLMSIPEIDRVIFNNPTTIVKWADGTKTVVKTDDHDIFDEEVGLAMAIVKKMFRTRSAFQKLVENADIQLPVVKKEKKAK
jgi:hypothetical protein